MTNEQRETLLQWLREAIEMDRKPDNNHASHAFCAGCTSTLRRVVDYFGLLKEGEEG